MGSRRIARTLSECPLSEAASWLALASKTLTVPSLDPETMVAPDMARLYTDSFCPSTAVKGSAGDGATPEAAWMIGRRDSASHRKSSPPKALRSRGCFAPGGEC